MFVAGEAEIANFTALRWPKQFHAIARLLVGVPRFAALTVFLLAGCSRAQPQAAVVPQQPPFEFIGQWGVSGDGPGQLEDPVGPAVDTFGRVYFASRGSGLLDKFDEAGVPLISFEADGVRHASGIAVDAGGGIYIADAAAGNIRVYFPEGDFLRTLPIAPEHNFTGPFGLSVAADGAVFVPDPAGGRIQVLSSQGKIERIWRLLPNVATGKSPKPVVAAVGPDGFVYVVDAQANRVVKYTREGVRVAAWDDSADDPAPLLGLAVSSNYIFMLRGASPRIVVWTLDGQRRLADDLGGRLNAAPRDAGSLALSPAGELVVLDPSAPRVLRFRLHL
jgi:DNA-binding beta-propeller fold protein YncE